MGDGRGRRRRAGPRRHDRGRRAQGVAQLLVDHADRPPGRPRHRGRPGAPAVAAGDAGAAGRVDGVRAPLPRQPLRPAGRTGRAAGPADRHVRPPRRRRSTSSTCCTCTGPSGSPWTTSTSTVDSTALLAERRIPVVWTAHNLTPHDKRPDVFDPIYQVWAEAVDAVIHHSAWGEARMRERYRFPESTRHVVIPHGHFGAPVRGGGRPPAGRDRGRAGAAARAGRRIGLLGAPRAEKQVQAFLDGFAASDRDDLQLVCWSLGPDDVVPDDPRIAVAEPYEMVDADLYARRLAACDLLALPFDPDGEMLATGVAADVVGLGLGALVSDWGYLTEVLGAAGIPLRPHPRVGHRRTRRPHRGAGRSTPRPPAAPCRPSSPGPSSPTRPSPCSTRSSWPSRRPLTTRTGAASRPRGSPARVEAAQARRASRRLAMSASRARSASGRVGESGWVRLDPIRPRSSRNMAASWR